jgi:hypothetical protein
MDIDAVKPPSKQERDSFSDKAYKFRLKHPVGTIEYYRFYLEHKDRFGFNKRTIPDGPPEGFNELGEPSQAAADAAGEDPMLVDEGPSAAALKQQRYRAKIRAQKAALEGASLAITPAHAPRPASDEEGDAEEAGPSTSRRPSERKKRRDVASVATKFSQTLEGLSPASQKQQAYKVFGHTSMTNRTVPSPLANPKKR